MQETEQPQDLKKVEATILFADIVGSLELANNFGVARYETLLQDWYEIAGRAVAMSNEWGVCPVSPNDVSIRGDELCVFFRSGDTRRDIRGALSVAAEVKVGWLLSEINSERFQDGKPPIEVGVGVHTGAVVDARRPRIMDYAEDEVFLAEKHALEGFSISVAKRLEGISRQGHYSKIILSHTTEREVRDLDIGVECHFDGRKQFPGITQPWPVYEVKSCDSLRTWMASHDPKKIARLEAFVEGDPQNVWLLATLAEAYRYAREVDKCIEVCRRALAVDGTLIYTHGALAWGLHKKRRWPEALQEADRTLALGARGTDVRLIRSSCLVALQQLDEAESECTRILAIDDEEPGAYYNLACIHVRRGDSDKALEDLRTAVRLGGEDVVESLQEDVDRDFVGIRGDPKYQELLKLKQTDVDVHADEQ